MGEFGAVDDDDGVGIIGERGVDRLIDPPDQPGEPREDGGRSHDCDVGKRKYRREPGGFHVRTAHTRKDKSLRPRFRLQGFDEFSAEGISGMLASDNEEPSCVSHELVTPKVSTFADYDPESSAAATP
jgi:hypothetical protein